MFEDTKGIIRSHNWKDRQYNGQKKKDRQYNGQKKKDRQYNGQKKKDKQTNNDLQKTNDWETRTPLKIGGELVCSGRINTYCDTWWNDVPDLQPNNMLLQS